MKRYPRCLMSTCCVAWDERGQLAEDVFRRGVRTAIGGTPHLYLFGTAGEGYALTDGQFDQIVAAFVDEMRQADCQPMVGIIHLSLTTILQRMQRCIDQGVRQFQISLPSWGALNDRELFTFFEQVCGSFPDCQFMHYNLPRAKRIVTGQEYGRLAELHPNLVATKNTGDSLTHLRSLIEDAPQLQHFLSESGYVYGSLFGECGILVSFVMNWQRQQELLRAGEQHDAATLVAIQNELTILRDILFDTVPGDRIDGAYDKIFAKLYDPEFPLRLLPPYEGTSDAEFEAFHAALRERLPSWLPPAATT